MRGRPLILFFFSFFVSIQAQAAVEPPPLTMLLPANEMISFSDMEPLKPLLKGVQAIGLGEANHGTSEFFRYKTRLIKFLVTHHEFRLFLLESGYFSCERLNAFVHGADVSLREALNAQHKSAWVTREFADLFIWMRNYNSGKAPAQRIEILGFDARDNGEARDILATYLKEKTPNFHLQIIGLLNKVALTGFEDRTEAMRGSTTLQEIEKHLTNLRHKEGIQAEIEVFQRVWRALQVLKQVSAYATAKNFAIANKSRDYFMAENIKAISAKKPGKKMMVWAHNGHIGVGHNGFPNGINLGVHLRKWLGTGYFALGFSFGSGTYRAYGHQNQPNAYAARPTGEPFPGSISACLGGWAQASYLLVLRGLDPIPRELRQPLMVRWSNGSSEFQNRQQWQDAEHKIIPANHFDAFIYVHNIKAATEMGADPTPP